LIESTVQFKIKIVKQLEFRFNLWDSENIKTYIKKSMSTNRRKNNVSYAYKDWCNWKGFEVKIDHFKEETQGLPYVPLEKELDQIIAGFGKKYFIIRASYQLASSFSSTLSSINPIVFFELASSNVQVFIFTSTVHLHRNLVGSILPRNRTRGPYIIPGPTMDNNTNQPIPGSPHHPINRLPHLRRRPTHNRSINRSSINLYNIHKA
jgi:hypothetical protein